MNILYLKGIVVVGICTPEMVPDNLDIAIVKSIRICNVRRMKDLINGLNIYNKEVYDVISL